MTAQLKAKLWSIDCSLPTVQTSHYFFSTTRGQLPLDTTPKLAPIYLCTDVQKDYHSPSSYLNSHISLLLLFFRVSPLYCRVQRYQLASNDHQNFYTMGISTRVYD
ncbi:hypothetical protein PROFUN_05904 [Planoprotostelium fungivorum]|uniref:Uncharacterized protein n=1 Tax=Planoprotostelium fungivorum TaxID=1890364 RepID=A0A2P6N7J5_9EUKA|nr:hypothetical protein PROFUN_05904 [Planoprotostelium fungivorum]